MKQPVTRIKREAQAMGKLGDHPNIVSIFDFGDHEGQPYIVLPLMSGWRRGRTDQESPRPQATHRSSN